MCPMVTPEAPRSLTVVMPVYNEAPTVEAVIQRVLAAPTSGLELELVVVDDGSQDGSTEILRRLSEADERITLHVQARNQGKGAALAKGFSIASGDVVLVQDADFEYDPDEYPILLQPILDGAADVVYGSRFLSGKSRRVLYFWHSMGNRFLTLLSNFTTNLNLTDMETCYKVVRRPLLQKIRLVERGFGVEPELTAKLARMRPVPRFYEVGISYHGRTYEEGKKIGWRDGVRAIYCIVRYGLF